MKKLLKRVCFCLVAAASIWSITVLCDRQRLNEELIRLHVVAASDSKEDQAVKLRVRDAVLESISTQMGQIADIEAARQYLQENLGKIELLANSVLKEAGMDETATVSLCRESFDTRYYDTFSLPAGVYEALRITIGAGEGKNWWCVAFPSLCISATAEGFEAVAAGAGFPEALTAALKGEEGYELRFYLLDLLGRLENRLAEE